MNEIIINDNNMTINNVNKFGNKSRAILIKKNKLLVAHYGGVFLFPGGSIDSGETPDQCIIRELKEEIGIDYSINNLDKFLILKYLQFNYPTRDNKVSNRLVTTHYYFGEYKGVNNEEFSRTESEVTDNFSLQLVDIDELEQLLGINTNNPRKEYFDREINEVIKVLSLRR